MKLPETSIRMKAMTFILLVATIPILAISYTNYVSIRAATEENKFNHLDSVALLKAYELDEWTQSQTNYVEMLAKLVEADVVKSMKAYSTNAKTHTGYHEELENTLNEFVDEDPDLHEVFLLDANTGRIHLSTNDGQVGKIKAHDAYFTRGLEGTFVKNVYYSTSLGEPSLTISTPLKNEAGETVAVLVIRMNLDTISEIMMERAGLGETGETYLINKFNFFISQSKYTTSNELKTAAYSKGINDCLEHNNGQGMYEDYRGIPVIGVYRWIPDREMCILAEIDQSEAFAPLNEMVFNASVIAALIALASMVFGFILSSTIIRPLTKLTDGAKRIGAGDFKHRIDVKSNDELGKLATAFNQMAEKVENRTEALSKANIKLKALDRLKSMFIASMSHELRTPLNSIIGFTGIMIQGMSGKLSREQKKQLGIVKSSSQHLLSLINDIIDLSKIEAGKAELDITEFDLVEVINEIEEELKLRAKESKLKLSTKTPKTIMVTSDERRVRQIITNFVSNAVKYSDKGSIVITAVKKGSNAVVTVKDTGIGIKPENMKHLFKAFSQILTPDRPKPEGTGLGLYLSKKLAGFLGGHISLESEYGKGSEFTFTLPLKHRKVKK